MKPRIAGLWLAMAVSSGLEAGTLPVVDTTKYDQLDVANNEPGSGGLALPTGGSVALFNGNLNLTIPLTPAYPQDGLLPPIQLVLSYNSKRARLDNVRTAPGVDSQFLSGRSWVGFGWTAHLGRVHQESEYYAPEQEYFSTRSFWEQPDGTPLRFETTVKRAQPNFTVKYYRDCIDFDPPIFNPPAYCENYPDAPRCNEPINPCDGRDGDPEHYDLFTSNGTLYRFEKRVDANATNGWIKNHDRMGFYPVSVKDLYNNEFTVSYADDDGPFPEAITQIQSIDHPEVAITTELCTASPTADCPSGTEGMLHRVLARGFKGSRSTALQTTYTLGYSTASITDADGSQTVPLLRRVTVSGSDGSQGGTTYFDYGTGVSLGMPVFYIFGPLLDRVTTSLGAIGEFKYEGWHSGSRLIGSTTSNRSLVGVVRYTAYVEGLNENGSISGKPHMSWNWERDFTSSTCAAGTTPTDTNEYRVHLPDGRMSRAEFFGDPCGRTADVSDKGQFGVPKSTSWFDSSLAKVRSVVVLQQDKPRDADHEIVRDLVQQTETTFHDDNGTCFGGSDSIQGKIRTTAFGRHDSNRWQTTVTSSDSYMPLAGGERRTQIRHTTFAAFPLDDPRRDKGIVPGPDYTSIEEGPGDGRRFETDYSYTTDGKERLLSTRTKNEWLPAATDPATGLPPPTVSTPDATDLLQTFSYDLNGNTDTVSYPAIPGYPSADCGEFEPQTNDCTPNVTYVRDVGYTQGMQTAAKWASSGAVTPTYNDLNQVFDATGLLYQTSDPNSLTTSYDYDGLGRPVMVAPPGSEHPVRYVYSTTLRTRAVIQSDGTETTWQSSRNQLFGETLADGLGRTVQEWRAMPRDLRSTRVIRYDHSGRVVFESEWMTEGDYTSAAKATWSSGDVDGNGVVDYTVSGVPLRDGRPWGTVYFFGNPNGTDPLQVTPDPLGRLGRRELADGSAVSFEYCGPHVATTVHGVRTDINSPATSDVTTIQYYDALGRLVLVDGPNEGADARYRYDAGGNLEHVKLLTLPSNPYQWWREGSPPLLGAQQNRTFGYDAAARLMYTTDPESGETRFGWTDGNGDWQGYYNSLGQPLIRRDQLALDRNFYLRTVYDGAGRIVGVTKVGGTPEAKSPSGPDLRLPPNVADLSSSGGTFGTISDDAFDDGTEAENYWKRVRYDAAACLTPPSDQSATSYGLYFGNTSTCSYGDAPAATQAVRYTLTGVTADDVVSFRVWRQVRESINPIDDLTLFLTTSPTNVAPDARKVIYAASARQSSLATWQEIYDIRVSDILDATFPQTLYLFIAFTKVDTVPSGLGTGVLIDDLFVGKRNREIMAVLSYDQDHCSQSPPAVGDACSRLAEPNRHLGKLTEVLAGQNGRSLDRMRYVYDGLNGRLSGINEQVYWALSAVPTEFLSRASYSSSGLQQSWTTPYQPGEQPRWYTTLFDRGLPDALGELGGLALVGPSATTPGVVYDPSGAPTFVHFATGAYTTYLRDKMGRVAGIESGEPSAVHFATGAYAYDGGGSISSIGPFQQFAYDSAFRLTDANVLPSASSPSTTATLDTTYGYDFFGNMTAASHAAPTPAQFNLSATYSGNRRTDGVFRYDAAGHLLRGTALNMGGGATALAWNSAGMTSVVFNGDANTGTPPAERYAYGADGARLVRFHESGTVPANGQTNDGKPRIGLQMHAGRTLAEYAYDTASATFRLDKEMVYGLGQLLVERTVSTTPPAPTTASTLLNASGIGIVLGSQGEVFSADIRTADGDSNFVDGLITDSSGVFRIPEGEFYPGEHNYVRITRQNEGNYSHPITVFIDPSVTSSSSNQIRAAAIAKTGTTLLVRWSLLNENAKNTRVKFQPTEGITTIVASSVVASKKFYTLDEQALATPCGVITLPQLNTDGTETAITLPTTVPRAIDFDSLDPPPSCDGFPIIIEPELITYDFANQYHHRDHLGSLRVTTDIGGNKTGAFDYYPYGRIIGVAEPAGSWFRFTGHERTSTGLDNMLARTKGSNSGSFLSPDFGDDLGQGSWNRYSYVASNPINYTDPLGLEAVNCNSAMHWSDPECNGDPSWFGYSDFAHRYFPRSRNFPIGAAAFSNLFQDPIFQTSVPQDWIVLVRTHYHLRSPLGPGFITLYDPPLTIVYPGGGWPDESLDWWEYADWMNSPWLMSSWQTLVGIGDAASLGLTARGRQGAEQWGGINYFAGNLLGVGGLVATGAQAGVTQGAQTIYHEAVGPAGLLIGRGTGIFNKNDFFRFGWGWNQNFGAAGAHILRFAGNYPGHWHVDAYAVATALPK
jgi:RHS repeat-associated protein